jgi:hypothetical protein
MRTPYVLAASGWIALASTALPPASPARVIATLAFLLWCPGAAVMRIVAVTTLAADRYEPMLAAALAVAVSLAIATLASAAFFLAGSFTVTRCLATLAAFTTVAAYVPRAIDGRHSRSRARGTSGGGAS